MNKHFSIFTFLILFQQLTSAQNTSSFSCGPIPALCIPGHVFTPPQGSLTVGMTYVQFGQISRTHVDTAGYTDYTCSDSTTIIQGNVYQFIARTGQTYEECVTAWIDFSNDGDFDTTEIIFADSAIVYTHAGYVAIPVLGMINIPLRMRVASDYSIPPPINACQPVQYGNYMDFTIYFAGPDAITEYQKSDLMVFPNPVTGDASITIQNLPDGLTRCYMKIYDAKGNLVSNELIDDPKAISIRRNQLSHGMFFFQLTSDSGFQSVGKFLVE